MEKESKMAKVKLERDFQEEDYESPTNQGEMLLHLDNYILAKAYEASSIMKVEMDFEEEADVEYKNSISKLEMKLENEFKEEYCQMLMEQTENEESLHLDNHQLTKAIDISSMVKVEMDFEEEGYKNSKSKTESIPRQVNILPKYFKEEDCRRPTNQACNMFRHLGNHKLAKLSKKGDHEMSTNQTEKISSDNDELAGHQQFESSQYLKSLCERSKLPSSIINVKKERLVKCNSCYLLFQNSAALSDHLMVNTGEKQYRCSQCHHSFNCRGKFYSHLNNHMNKNRFKCSMCDKSFRLRSLKILHAREHTHELPFKCEVCHRSYYNKTNLTRHLKTHF